MNLKETDVTPGVDASLARHGLLGWRRAGKASPADLNALSKQQLQGWSGQVCWPQHGVDPTITAVCIANRTSPLQWVCLSFSTSSCRTVELAHEPAHELLGNLRHHHFQLFYRWDLWECTSHLLGNSLAFHSKRQLQTPVSASEFGSPLSQVEKAQLNISGRHCSLLHIFLVLWHSPQFSQQNLPGHDAEANQTRWIWEYLHLHNDLSWRISTPV